MLGLGRRVFQFHFLSEDKDLWKVLSGFLMEALSILSGGKLRYQTEEAWTRSSVVTRNRKSCSPVTSLSLGSPVTLRGRWQHGLDLE